MTMVATHLQRQRHVARAMSEKTTSRCSTGRMWFSFVVVRAGRAVAADVPFRKDRRD
jgi:hypothetical protein